MSLSLFSFSSCSRCMVLFGFIFVLHTSLKWFNPPHLLHFLPWAGQLCLLISHYRPGARGVNLAEKVTNYDMVSNDFHI